MKKIYLGPSYLKSTLLKSLNQDITFDIEYKSIEDLINKYKTADDFDTVKNNLRNLSLSKFNLAINDDDFIKEVIQIKDYLAKYKNEKINVDNELQKILDCINITYDIKLNENYADYYILDVKYDLYENKVIDELYNLGAHKHAFNKYSNNKYLLVTNNIRQEIEYVIQDIINNNYNLNDCGIVLCDNNNDNLYKSVLYRYDIPYEYNGEINQNAITFINIIDYYVNRDTKSYLNLINRNLIINSNNQINIYLNKHSNNYEDCFNKFINDEKYFVETETKAEEIRKANEELTHRINNCNSLLEAFDVAYSSLPEGRDKQQIQTLLSTYYSKDITIDNYEKIKVELSHLKTINKYEESVLISTLDKQIYNRKYLYVLDASSTCYPSFKQFDGVVKEEDLIDTNFPSLTSRRNNYLDSLSYLSDSEKTTFIVPEVSYDGKSIEPSLLIDAQKLDAEVIENEKIYNNTHDIDQLLLKDTFLKGNELKGSISSFEKYQSCPYSYYLRYVLGLKVPDDKSLSPATIGSLFHNVLETLVKDNGKKYCEYTREDIEKLINDDVNKLINHYPNDIKMIEFSKDNFIDSLMLEKEFLKIVEEESNFNDFKTEYHFDKEIINHNDISLKLNGSIDRVDIKDNFYRILDYKSSNKNISLSDVSKGLQLQLFTYAYIFNKETDKTPTGIFYVNINTKKDSKVFYRYTIKGGIEQISLNEVEDFINEKRLSGIVFGDEYTSYLYNGTASIKKTSIDFKEVENAIKAIYEYIIDRILEADFEIKPVKDACKYCDYSRICHHPKSIEFDREKIYEINK